VERRASLPAVSCDHPLTAGTEARDSAVFNGLNAKMSANKTHIVHLFVLTCLAIAQPLFDQLSHNAEFFVARGSNPLDILVLVALLCVALPGVLVGLELLAGRINTTAGTVVHAFFVTILIALIILPILKRFEIDPYVLVFLALIAGGGISILQQRQQAARMMLTFLSPALIIVPGMFLLSDPISGILTGGSAVTGLQPVNATAPVVMVIFDEFPLISLLDDKAMVDPVRYPNFARLMRESYWFRNTSTVATLTPAALPAILTGCYPAEKHLPTARDYPNSLFSLLGGSYKMKVIESATRLFPPGLPNRLETPDPFLQRMRSMVLDLSAVYPQIVLPIEFSENLPSVTQTWGDFWSQTGSGEELDEETLAAKRNRPAIFARFVAAVTPEQQPTLYFLHILLPHKPWKYLPSGREYNERGSSVWQAKNQRKGIWDSDEFAVAEQYGRHLLQLGFVDKLIGDLLDRLKQAGLYDPSLIIMAADHGIGFSPGESLRNPSRKNVSQIMMVPLFIKAPHQTRGAVLDQRVETIDILPTIAQILNISIPWQVDGQPALSPDLRDRTSRILVRREGARQEEFQLDMTKEDPALQRKLTLFGSGTGFDRVFQFGPHAELIGKRVDEIGMRKRVPVTLTDENAYRNVDLNAQVQPVFISGVIRETLESITVAIAVNDVVRAVTKSFSAGAKGSRFGAVVSETSFRPGKNEVAVYLLDTE